MVDRLTTGYSQEELEAQLKRETDFETFFSEAPRLNPSRALITGVVCGVRVEDIEEPDRARDPLPRQAHRRVGEGEGHAEDPPRMSRGRSAQEP
jgi:hypothetical protein